MIRNDVGFVTAIGDDAVDPILGEHVLPKLAHKVVRRDACVERVATHERHCGSVCLEAPPRYIDLSHPKERGRGRSTTSRVNHHGAVDTCETTCSGDWFFAAAAFFGWSADQLHCAFEHLHERGGGQKRPDACGTDDVVTASMTDSMQCIVFSEDRDQWAAGTDLSSERCLQPDSAYLNVYVVRRHHLGHGGCGLGFLKSQLGVSVNRVRQVDRPASIEAGFADN